MPAGRVRVHQAGAGRGVVRDEPERGVAEFQAEHDPAVARGHVGTAVTIDPVRGGHARVLDHAEQVHGHQPQAGHRDSPAATVDTEDTEDTGAASAWPGWGWSQLARFAPGSSTRQNASAGPLISVLGPGPWPNSMHWPVEMTPTDR